MIIQKIQRLDYPKTIPSIEAISSYSDSIHSYDPDFWEFKYHIHRYLDEMATADLTARYYGILKNMKTIISQERHIIPIQSYTSSWYWYKKEFQTRLEFKLRQIDPPEPPSIDQLIRSNAIDAPFHPKYPNSGEYLYRYDKKQYTTDLANFGKFRIRPASDFQKLENDPARCDIEWQKSSYMPGKSTKIMTSNGTQIQAIGYIRKTKSLPDYYMFCMSCDWDRDLFNDFGESDSCLIARNADEFASRLESTVSPELPNWHFHHNPVEYFDPYDLEPIQRVDAGMSKDFLFAYQREYRFIWFPPAGECPSGFKYFTAGPLTDIAQVYY